jgi:acetoin utilization protein AcuB
MESNEILTMDDYMTLKPISIQSGEPVGRALQLMLEHGIRHLPVVDGDQLVGILSDRDIQQSWGKKFEVTGETDFRQSVSAIMTGSPICANADTSIGAAVKLMIRHRIGSLPVVDLYGQLVGIFTETDALQYCLLLMERYQKKRVSF